ncbi:hypothetical protein Tco_0920315 [Tanacetum coccineum]
MFASVSFSDGCHCASFVSVLAQNPCILVLLPLMTCPLIERELKLLELALIHTKLSLEGRLFLDDLDQRTLPADQAGYDVLICSKYSCTFANASAQNDNASLEAGGKATIVQPQQEYWFRLSTTTVSVQVLRKNNLSLEIALNHRKKVFENFWSFILGS